MADTKDNARDELLYVTASAPATESELRLPASYTRVGMVITDSLALSRNMIDANDKDSGEGESVIPGRSSGTVAVTCNRPKDGNAGQLVINDAYTNRTLLYFLKSDNTVGDRAVHFTGYVENYEEGSDDEDVRKLNFTIRVQGFPTFFEIQT